MDDYQNELSQKVHFQPFVPSNLSDCRGLEVITVHVLQPLATDCNEQGLSFKLLNKVEFENENN